MQIHPNGVSKLSGEAGPPKPSKPSVEPSGDAETNMPSDKAGPTQNPVSPL